MSTFQDINRFLDDSIHAVIEMKLSDGDSLEKAEAVLQMMIEIELTVELITAMVPETEDRIGLHTHITKAVRKAHDDVITERLFRHVMNGGTLPDCNCN
jgi:hypothetical protein